jgi:hypothetical protein
MASPPLPPNPEPIPALLSPNTPRAIRDALIDSEREEFERRYAEEMAEAARTLDLTGVLSVLDAHRKIAEITQRQGVEAHRKIRRGGGPRRRPRTVHARGRRLAQVLAEPARLNAQ